MNAPMMQINQDYFEDLDETSVNKIFDAINQNKPLNPGSYKGRKSSAPENNINNNGEEHA